MKYNDAEDLLASFKPGQVYLFHGKIETEQPHYQVLLNKDFNKTSPMVYLSVSTTKIEKRESNRAFHNFPKETLVIVEIGEVSFLKQRSCFDCNSISSCSIHEIYWEYLGKNAKLVWNIPNDILQKIYQWISVSPAVSDAIKKAIWIL